MTSRKMVAIAAVAAGLGTAAVAERGGEHALHVTSATLQVRTAAARQVTGFYQLEVEFTEDRLDDLRDDEADVEISVLDRDGHGGRRRLEDLEDCRMTPNGSMSCPGGIVFERIAEHPRRWKLAIAFSRPRPPDAFRGPVTVRLAYSVSGGTTTVHVGTIASCAPTSSAQTLTCRVARQSKPAPASAKR